MPVMHSLACSCILCSHIFLILIFNKYTKDMFMSGSRN